MLQLNNAVDFDDLLLYTARILEEHPEVREKYARRFEHVLVDEFQDTNLAQYVMLKHLSSYHHNIFVVGDEDQSIYRWRGADYRNVLRFEKDFPKCETILLEQNYRSTQNVLDAARQVIDRNRNRTPKHLFTERGSGSKIIQYVAVDDIAEAAFVVDTISQYLKSGKASANDFAVMYRTNAQSRLIEEALMHAGLPYRLVGAQRFYGRREVKDMICLPAPGGEPRRRSQPAAGDQRSPARHRRQDHPHPADRRHAGWASAWARCCSTWGKTGDASPYWSAVGRPAALLADFGALLAEWQSVKDKICAALAVRPHR